MGINSIPIRFEDMKDIQLQLLFEELMFADFEKDAIKYCQWLLKLGGEQRRAHHDSLARMAHAVRTADGRIVDITPECDCLMCAQWHTAAVRELWRQAEAVQIEREQAKKSPRRPQPTFLYLMLDERNGYIKIGRAKDPAARERTLQSENPRVTLLFSGTADADLERELHQRYDEFRIRGEWFKLSPSQIEDIKDRIKLGALHEQNGSKC